MNVNDIQYGLVAKDETGEIVHFVGYTTEPTIEQAEHFAEELRNDEEFGLGDIVDSLTIEEADWTTVTLYRTYLKEELGKEELEEGWN